MKVSLNPRNTLGLALLLLLSPWGVGAAVATSSFRGQGSRESGRRLSAHRHGDRRRRQVEDFDDRRRRLFQLAGLTPAATPAHRLTWVRPLETRRSIWRRASRLRPARSASCSPRRTDRRVASPRAWTTPKRRYLVLKGSDLEACRRPRELAARCGPRRPGRRPQRRQITITASRRAHPARDRSARCGINENPSRPSATSRLRRHTDLTNSRPRQAAAASTDLMDEALTREPSPRSRATSSSPVRLHLPSPSA